MALKGLLQKFAEKITGKGANNASIIMVLCAIILICSHTKNA